MTREEKIRKFKQNISDMFMEVEELVDMIPADDYDFKVGKACWLWDDDMAGRNRYTNLNILEEISEDGKYIDRNGVEWNCCELYKEGL